MASTNVTTQRTLVLLWRSLGPYHLARAAAAARLLEAQGLRAVVVELCDAEETREWLTDRSTAECEVRTLSPGVQLTDRSRNFSAELLAVLEEIRPCCVAVAGYDRPEMRAALRWANRRGAGAVLMSETKWDDRPRPWWRRMLASRLVRRADAALVSGGAAGEYLVALGMPRERIFRQYGAVDNAYFRERAAALRRHRNRTREYFLVCSRLIESRKNIARLLRAYAGYRAGSTAAWDLVICGDGCDRGAYEQLVARERIQGVEFAGFQQLDGLSAYLAGASCFVHAAVNEAWGLVVNEALASGLPVLVSRRCGCAPDLVHEGVNGFTFDPYDVDSLSALLQHMSQLPVPQRDAMGAASSQIVSRFGCEQFAAGLAEAMAVACRVRQGVTVLSRHAVPVDCGAEQTGAVDADIGPLGRLEPADSVAAVR
jgi:glycosyltransferase involved in cell wall biosynthesis